MRKGGHDIEILGSAAERWLAVRFARAALMLESSPPRHRRHWKEVAMATDPHPTALPHGEPTDVWFEETRRAEHDLVRGIVIGIAVAVPACVVMFMAAVGFDASYESVPLGGPLAMGAAVGTLAGLFFGAWLGFVFKGHAFDELDRKAAGHEDGTAQQS